MLSCFPKFTHLKMKTRLLLLLFIVSNAIYAQTNNNTLKKFIDATNASVTLNTTNNTPEFIIFPFDQPLVVNGNSVKEKSQNFINLNADLLGIHPNNLILKETRVDNYGMQHVIFDQLHNGVKVFDGQLRFHFNSDQKVTSINGTLISGLKVNSQPQITASQASGMALQYVSNQNLSSSNVPLMVIKTNLYVFQKGLIENKNFGDYLVYEVEVRNNNDVREYLFIDAFTGEIVQQFTGMAHINRQVYENNTFNLVWQEGDAFPGSLTNWQQNEVVASEDVYNFFENAFGYVSYDNQDATMVTINNNPNISCPNANWNGVSANYCDGTAADDVIAHEWGHAYTEYTSGLIYYYQSGALNESFSDVWGETVDLLNNYEDFGEDLSIRTGISCTPSLRWKVGEDATAFGGAIRDMYNPPCNNDPGRVGANNYWCSPGDSGGVHINSGIPNHAYALLVDGGSYNGYIVTGIGFTKAAHIFWRAQSQYLTPTSDFSVFADALEASANDLLGINLTGLSTDAPVGPSGEIITAADITQLNNALLAVELRMNPDQCGFTPLLSETTTLCNNATSGALYTQDWENGLDGWTVSNVPSNPSSWEPRDWVLEPNLPKSRPGTGVFGADPIIGDCGADLENGILRLESPVINLPSGVAGDFELAFNHNVSTEFQWDGTNVKYSKNGGVWKIVPASAFTTNAYNDVINPASSGNDNPLQGQAAFTGYDEGGLTGSWVTSVVNFANMNVNAGDSIQLRFEVGTDGCNGTVGWYLDEIYVYNCSVDLLSVQNFETLDKSIRIYPNPSNGIFNIQNNGNINLTSIEVIDINGRVIKSNTSTFNQVDLNDVSNGIYFVKLKSNSTTITKKVIKN